MNNIILKVITRLGFNILILLISFPSLAQATCSDPDGRKTYPMICRGPMEIEIGSGGSTNNSRIPFNDFNDVVFRFTPATIAAGETGERLNPGTCSWVNRAPRGDEVNTDHAVIRFTFEHPGKRFLSSVVLGAISDCNFNSNCRIKVCARSNGSHQYWWRNQVDIIPAN